MENNKDDVFVDERQHIDDDTSTDESLYTDDIIHNNSKNYDQNNSNCNKPQENSTRKLIFCLSYIFGILFFLPMLIYKDEEAKFHSNQALVLLLFGIVGEVLFGVLSIIPVLSIIFYSISGIYGLALFVLCVVGIVYVCKNETKPLPFIGRLVLLK